MTESINESAKIYPNANNLSRQGEDLVKWLNTVTKEKSIESIDFREETTASADNSCYVTFKTNTDLSVDMFSLIEQWKNAPKDLDLYIDTMSVNGGKLVAVIFAKPGIKFIA